MNKKIKSIYQMQLRMPPYKLSYALRTGILEGAFLSIKNYGFKINKEAYKIFYYVLSSYLSGSSEIEHEWTEEEYKELMKIKDLI